MKGNGPTQQPGNNTLTSEEEHSINFTEEQKKLCLGLHYNEVNNYIFVNGVEIYKFKAKGSEINVDSLCLGNISKHFLVDSMNKTRWYGYVRDFQVDYDSIDVDDILNTHKNLMVKNNMKQ